jgi:hypothetical protein
LDEPQHAKEKKEGKERRGEEEGGEKSPPPEPKPLLPPERRWETPSKPYRKPERGGDATTTRPRQATLRAVLQTVSLIARL